MEFGKVPDLQSIDLRLPEDDSSVARLLPGRRETSPRVYAGCPVWQDDALANRVCPPGTPKARRLSAYARQFVTTELNSTGYGLDPAKARDWASVVPAEFRFCPKIPRDVTLAPNLDAVHAVYVRHCEALTAFGDRLGPVLLQFPDNFGPSRLPQLERLLALPRPGFRMAVEVRHPAWFGTEDRAGRLADLLEKNGIAMVITDSPGRRDAIHMRLTAPWAFIRFQGHDGYAEDMRRLETWSDRVTAWLDRGLKEAYFFPHLDPVEKTADLAAHFLLSLRRMTGLDLRLPRLHADEDEPRLELW